MGTMFLGTSLRILNCNNLGFKASAVGGVVQIVKEGFYA